MASDSHTIASLKTIKICQSKFSGSRVSEQLLSKHLLLLFFYGIIMQLDYYN